MTTSSTFPKLILIFFTLLIQGSVRAQQAGPVEVTPEIEKHIQESITVLAKAYKAKLLKAGESALTVEFSVDTFRAERYFQKYMEYDGSNTGMATAAYRTGDLYDSLMNKYYKRVLGRLQGDDKKALINTQKAWLKLRDLETELSETLGKDQYSGGGSIQLLYDADNYYRLIKSRTVTIYEYLERITQP